MAIILTCLRCGQDSETVLYASVEYLELVELTTYVECILSSIGKVLLSVEFVIKMVQPPYLRGEQFVFSA